MADINKIKEQIREIAGRPKNVTLVEIERVVKQLGENGYDVASRPATHGRLFRVGTQRFMVNHHSPGSRQVKSYSVKDFVNAMIELDLYD